MRAARAITVVAAAFLALPGVAQANCRGLLAGNQTEGCET